VLEPGVGATERAGTKAAEVLSAVDFAAHQTGALEHHQMLGNGVEGDRKGSAEFGDRGGLARKPLKDGAARGIGDGREDEVEMAVRTFNHTVEYYPGRTAMSMQFLKTRAWRW